MKILFSFLLFLIALNCKSQTLNDSLHQISKPITSFGFVPIVSYDSDLGLRYGLVGNRFVYADTSNNKRKYTENFFARVFNTTKGSFQTQVLLESERLLPHSKTFLEFTYLFDQSFDFFGFNGDESVYNKSYTDAESPLFVNKHYYQMTRRLLRLRTDWQYKIKNTFSSLLIGYSYNKYMLQQANDQDLSLFNLYKKESLIIQKEQDGGLEHLFSLGFVYENRNNQSYCTDGNWFESYLVYSPVFLSDNSFAKLICTYRTYHQLHNDRIVMTARISVQTKISGEIPFYMLTNYFDTRLNQDGLGGAFNLRGINRNRVIANGFGLLNSEIRFNIVKPLFLKKRLNIDISVYNDNVLITQKYKYNSSLNSNSDFINKNPSNLYSTLGFGLYFVMNQNNIINLNWGFSIFGKEQLQGLYIGSSFLF